MEKTSAETGPQTLLDYLYHYLCAHTMLFCGWTGMTPALGCHGLHVCGPHASGSKLPLVCMQSLDASVTLQCWCRWFVVLEVVSSSIAYSYIHACTATPMHAQPCTFVLLPQPPTHAHAQPLLLRGWTICTSETTTLHYPLQQQLELQINNWILNSLPMRGLVSFYLQDVSRLMCVYLFTAAYVPIPISQCNFHDLLADHILCRSQAAFNVLLRNWLILCFHQCHSVNQIGGTR